MATPTLLSVSNVALPNTADSGNVSVTAPTGANACVIGGTFYVGDNSVASSLTGSQLASTTNGALRTATPSGGNYMSSYAAAFQVLATGSQTIRLQKTGGYQEGPTCQIIWLTVDDPTDFVRTGGFLIDTQASSPDTLSVTVNSATTDLVVGMFGTDGSSADPSAPTGTTLQGTLQTTQFDKSISFSVNSPGASTTTVTAGSRDYPSLFAIALKAGSGGGATNYSLTCDVGSYSLTGIAALLRRGYSLVGTAGSYALTGQDAALRRGYRLAADPGSYALAGQDAALRRGYSLTLDVGSYALSGQDASLRRGYSLALDTGAYSLAGTDATLTYSAGGTAYSLVCDAGAYALTGNDAGLTYTPGPANYSITGDPGSYALAGNAAGLTFGRRLVLDVGSYGLSGQAAALIYGRRLVCEPGVYTLTGGDADLIVTTTGPTAYSLTCETGAYLLGGSDAALIYTDGSAPVRSNAGFVLVDHEPKSWWKRKPKAVPVAVAEKRIKRVAKAIDEIAAEKIEQDEPINQREVRAEIAPLLAEMPGFDFRPLFKAIVEFRQAEAARLEAIAQIERIRAIEQDDEDVLILLMSF